MHKGSWQTSKRRLECTGCSDIVEPGTSFMLARFSIDKPETNITSFITMYLCAACIEAYENYAHSPEDTTLEIANDDEPA